MSVIKRTIAYFLAFVLFCGAVLSMPLYTEAANVDPTIDFTVNVDVDGLIAYLEESLTDCPKRVDVSRFAIPYTNADGVALQRLVWHGTPVLFHVNGIGLSGSNGIIDYIYFTYHYDADTYQRMYRQCVSAAETMVGDLAGNSAIDDVTKALIIHDRIIVNCEYDLTGVNSGNISNESQEMYGALVNGLATCQGYSYAYMYLLRLVGIQSYICTSNDMCHDWNIVILNGKKYHVDVTFDDPVQDVTGRVYHNYFLLSTKALKQAEHNYNDFDTSPSDSTYDNYYWRSSSAEFVVVDGKVYYINNTTETINRVGTLSAVTKVSDVWTTAEGNYWIGNFSRLSSDGVNLLYSKSDGIYLYDIAKGSTKSVYKPALTGEARNIYGFTYKNGYLVIDRYNRPDFGAGIKTKYQLRVPYDTEAPKASLSYTSNLSAYQTVTMTLSDNNGIAGYYWGREQNYALNDYTATNKSSVNEYVSEPGIYYLTARDTAGNISYTVSVTFYSTRLETDGGHTAVTNIITPKAASFSLPAVSRSGYEFIGWSRSYTDSGEYITTYTPTGNGVLYALWRYTGEDKGDQEQPPCVNPFTDVSDCAWYADAVLYCAGRGYVKGISDTLFSPSSKLTREQFVLILANVAEVNTDSYKYADSHMTDVPVGMWYSGAVAWGVSEGYVKGVSADRFGRGQNITREQLARLFYVYAEDVGMDVSGRASLTAFADRARVSDWAYENVEWAVYSGIISGMTATTLDPRGSATRAQTARMFMIFDNLE